MRGRGTKSWLVRIRCRAGLDYTSFRHSKSRPGGAGFLSGGLVFGCERQWRPASKSRCFACL